MNIVETFNKIVNDECTSEVIFVPYDLLSFVNRRSGDMVEFPPASAPASKRAAATIKDVYTGIDNLIDWLYAANVDPLVNPHVVVTMTNEQRYRIMRGVNIPEGFDIFKTYYQQDVNITYTIVDVECHEDAPNVFAATLIPGTRVKTMTVFNPKKSMAAIAAALNGRFGDEFVRTARVKSEKTLWSGGFNDIPHITIQAPTTSK